MYIEKALNELNIKNWFVTNNGLSIEEVTEEDFINQRWVKTEKDFNERVRILVSVDEDGNETISDEIGVTWDQVKSKADEIEYEEKAKAIREKRDALLKESDWSQGNDLPEDLRATWAIYRQALRDLTEQDGFPENVVWPESP